jgi:hypothetical protein
MGQVILRAFEAGSSLRAIAAAAGMSHEKVRIIVATERKRRTLPPSGRVPAPSESTRVGPVPEETG